MGDGEHGARLAMLRAKLAQLIKERGSAHRWELDRHRSTFSMTEAIAMAHQHPAWAPHLDSIDINRFRAASQPASQPSGGCGGQEQQGSPMTASSHSKETLALPDPPSAPMGIKLGDIASVEIVSVPPSGLALRLHLHIGSATDAPATAANIAYQESLGITVRAKHLLVDAEPGASIGEPEPESVPGRSRGMGL